MLSHEGNRRSGASPTGVAARHSGIAAIVAGIMLVGLQPAQAADGAPTVKRSSPAAGNNAEQDVTRLIADIREAEARVASLQSRLELLRSDARLNRLTTQRFQTTSLAVGPAESADPAPDQTRPLDDKPPLKWLAGALALAAACILVMASLGALRPRRVRIAPQRPLSPLRRILRNCSDLLRERKRRARQEKRLHDHLKKIAASAKASHTTTRTRPQLRVVR